MTHAPKEADVPQALRVGRYAVQLIWSDGHQTGIYSFDYLRALDAAAPAAVAPPAPAAPHNDDESEPAMTYSPDAAATQAEVLQALRSVQDPDLRRDIVGELESAGAARAAGPAGGVVRRRRCSA